MMRLAASPERPSFRLHELPPEVLDLMLQKVSAPEEIGRLVQVSKSLQRCLQKAHLYVKLCRRPEIEGPSEVETARCRRILVSLTKQFPRIVSLDLSHTNLTDADIISAIQNLKDLSHLSVANCTKVTSSLPMFLQHRHDVQCGIAISLESLNLSRCFQLTDEAIYRVLRWSALPNCHLKAVSFAKMNIETMNEAWRNSEFLEELGRTAQGLLPTVRTLPGSFQWSRLRFLSLNNVRHIGLCALELIVVCCPNLAVMGLGGSTVYAAGGYSQTSVFGQVYSTLCQQHCVASGDGDLCVAWLCALVASLPRLWLLELTFFPEAAICDFQTLCSEGSIHMTPQQHQWLCTVDFCSTQSVLDYHDLVVKPFQSYLIGDSARRGSGADDWRFEDLPAAILDLMITTASSTSRGGSLLAPDSAHAFMHTPLHGAADRGDDAHVRALIKIGTLLELRGRGSGSALFRATREGRVSVVLLLLESQVNPLPSNRHDETSLYTAALSGHTKVVDVIVSYCEFYGVDWKRKELYRDGWSPVMAAAVADRCDVAKCLLYAAGSEARDLVRIKNRYGQTALHIAVYRQCAEMIELLLDAGGEGLLSEVDCYGRSALAFAQSAVAYRLIQLPDVLLGMERRQVRWRRWVQERDCPLDYLKN